MRRGEVWLVDTEPVRRSKANKSRPVVLVSNDVANATAVRLGKGVVTVVPVTSSTVRVFPFQVVLTGEHTGLATASKAQAEQVRSLDVTRLVRRLGALSGDEVKALDAALRLHFELDR